jgi:polysaccharide pyruvyl transferase WcaK-like protein
MRWMLLLLFLNGCATARYEKVVYGTGGKVIARERVSYNRLGDQKIQSAKGWDGAVSVEGFEATSELGKHVMEGVVEGLK